MPLARWRNQPGMFAPLFPRCRNPPHLSIRISAKKHRIEEKAAPSAPFQYSKISPGVQPSALQSLPNAAILPFERRTPFHECPLPAPSKQKSALRNTKNSNSPRKNQPRPKPVHNSAPAAIIPFPPKGAAYSQCCGLHMAAATAEQQTILPEPMERKMSRGTNSATAHLPST